MKLEKQESNSQALCLLHRCKFYELSMVLGSSTIVKLLTLQPVCNKMLIQELFLNGSTLLRRKSGPINVGWGRGFREHLDLPREKCTAA